MQIVCSIILLATLCPADANPLHADPPVQQAIQVWKERQTQILQDRSAITDPKQRWNLTAELITSLKLNEGDEASFLQALSRLQTLNLTEAAPALCEYLEFSPHQLSFQANSYTDLFPVANIVSRLGKPVLPILIGAAADRSALNDSSLKIATVLTIHWILRSNTNEPTRQLLNQYANEYEFGAMRLRVLAKQLPITQPNLIVLAPVEEGPLTQEGQVTRLARIFELQELIQDEKLTIKDETKVVAAIEELGKLGAVEAASTLADKLDIELPAPPLKPTGHMAGIEITEVMSADPKGLLSPKITEAAMKALLQIGAPALPAVIEAVSQRLRPARFRSNASTLILQITGSQDAARQALTAAATQNDAKAKRLRDLAASLPKTN